MGCTGGGRTWRAVIRMGGWPLLLGVILLSAFPAQAQERKNTWELGVFTGLIQFGEDGIRKDDILAEVVTDADFVTGIRIAYNASNHWMAEVVWDVTLTQFEAPYEDIAIDYNSIQLNGIYNFRNNIAPGVDPYLTAGFGLIDIEVEGTRFDQSAAGGLGRPTVDWLPYDNNNGTVETTENMYHYGLGLRVFGTENFGFRFELKQRRYDIWESRSSDEEFTFGLMWTVGRPPTAEVEEEIPLDLD